VSGTIRVSEVEIETSSPPLPSSGGPLCTAICSISSAPGGDPSSDAGVSSPPSVCSSSAVRVTLCGGSRDAVRDGSSSHGGQQCASGAALVSEIYGVGSTIESPVFVCGDESSLDTSALFPPVIACGDDGRPGGASSLPPDAELIIPWSCCLYQHRYGHVPEGLDAFPPWALTPVYPLPFFEDGYNEPCGCDDGRFAHLPYGRSRVCSSTSTAVRVMVNGVVVSAFVTQEGPTVHHRPDAGDSIPPPDVEMCGMNHSMPATVDVIVNDVSAKSLMDSGAQPCAINYEWVMRHISHFDSQPLPSSIKVHAVNGDPLEIVGRVRMKVQLAGAPKNSRLRQKTYISWAYVIKGLRHDVILGLDFMILSRLNIDFANGVVRHGVQQWELPLDYAKTRQGLLTDPRTQICIISDEEKIVQATTADHIKVRLDKPPACFAGDTKELYVVSLDEQEGVAHAFYGWSRFTPGQDAYVRLWVGDDVPDVHIYPGDVVAVAELPLLGPGRHERIDHGPLEFEPWDGSAPYGGLDRPPPPRSSAVSSSTGLPSATAPRPKFMAYDKPADERRWISDMIGYSWEGESPFGGSSAAFQRLCQEDAALAALVYSLPDVVSDDTLPFYPPPPPPPPVHSTPSGPCMVPPSMTSSTPPAPTGPGPGLGDDSSEAIKKEMKAVLHYDGADIDAAQQDAFTTMLLEEFKAFALDPNKPGYCDWTSLVLDTGDHPPIRLKAHRLAPVQQAALDKQVDRWLESDVVQPSSSEWAFPVVVVKKKDADGNQTGWRCCIDYRRLNDILSNRHINYPLPLVDEALDSMHGTRFFRSTWMI
jgi:hypothetical protein